MKTQCKFLSKDNTKIQSKETMHINTKMESASKVDMVCIRYLLTKNQVEEAIMQFWILMNILEGQLYGRAEHHDQGT